MPCDCRSRCTRACGRELDQLAHMGERGFFQSGNLRLTDADFAGNLHLCSSLKEAEGENALLPFIQAAHGFADSDVLQPVFRADAFIAYLIADGQRVGTVPADGLAQAVGDLLNKGLGFGKNTIDLFSVATTCGIGLLFTGNVVAIGLGTLIAMIGVGRCIALFNFVFKKKMYEVSGLVNYEVEVEVAQTN